MKILNTLLISLLAYSASAQVGIGTSSPTVPLDIEAADAAIDINNTSTDPLIHFQVSGTTNFTIGTDVTDSKFKIGTTALETGTAVTVQPTGEVGIGTSSPTATLDVDGSAIFNESGNSVDFRVEGLGEANLLFVDGSADAVGIGTASPGSILHISDAAAVELRLFTTTASTLSEFWSGNGTMSYGFGMGTDNKGHIIQNVNAKTIRMTFDGAKVGIGTTSPNTYLDVTTDQATTNQVVDMFNISYSTTGTSAAGIGAGLVFQVEDGGDTEEQGRINVELDDVTNGSEDATMTFDINQGGTMTEVMRIDGTAGNVGIGTATPLEELHVDGQILTTTVTYGNSQDKAYLIAGSQSYTGATTNWGTYGFQHRLKSDGAGISRITVDNYAGELFCIDDVGNVGIGSTSPGAKLQIDGDSGFEALRVSTSSQAVARFSRNTNDGVVIYMAQDGTVEGSISVSGTTVSYNAFTGSHFGYSVSESFKRGMLVIFNGDNERFHGNPESEILYGIEYSAKPNDSKVAGVFLDILESTQTLSLDNPYQIMAAGNGDVWVTDEGGDITTGDYLISSSVVGHAMKDNGDYEVSHIFSKATESVDWSTVQPDSNGVKRKKIIVYFEAFDKPNYEKKFKEQQAINEAQKQEIETIKAEASSNTTETAQKLSALEAKLNALLLLNSKGAVLTAEH